MSLRQHTKHFSFSKCVDDFETAHKNMPTARGTSTLAREGLPNRFTLVPSDTMAPSNGIFIQIMVCSTRIVEKDPGSTDYILGYPQQERLYFLRLHMNDPLFSTKQPPPPRPFSYVTLIIECPGPFFFFFFFNNHEVNMILTSFVAFRRKRFGLDRWQPT